MAKLEKMYICIKNKYRILTIFTYFANHLMQFQLSVQTTVVLMNEIPAHANTQYTRKSRALVLSLQAGHITGNSSLSTLLTYSWLAA